MDIKVSYDSSVTASNFSGGAAEEAQFKNAINYVIGLFDQLFTNPISFTIDVGWGEAAGNSVPSYALAVNYANNYTYNKTLTYAQVKQDLKNNSSGSDVQNLAYSHLPSTDPTNGGYFKLTDAEAEALGLTSSNGGLVDQLGFVTNPNGGNWDFDTTTGPGPNQPTGGQTDFVGVFEHELTEAMGRVSLAGGPGGVNSPLDLFRYSAPGAVDPAAVPSGTTNTAYLSFDGGVTSDGIFNNDAIWNGNPYDLGDWTQDAENGNALGGGTGPQGADAFGTGYNGVLLPFTYDDLEEMNVLGWNLSTGDDQVPEGVTEYANTTLPGAFDVKSGGYLDVGAAGTVLFTTLESGAFEDVFGTDSTATIYAGDFQYGDQIGQGQRVDAGGTALYATIDGGEQEIEAGGKASNTTLNGGLQKVFGSATATTIAENGQQWIIGKDSGSTVEAGGIQNIYANGTDSGSTIDAGGQQDDNLGGAAHEDTVAGQQFVYGVSYYTVVKSGGQQTVETGGVAYNTQVDSGGTLSIYGAAEGLTVYSGGSATVYQGGALQDWKQSAVDDWVEDVDGALTFDLIGSYDYKGQLNGDGSLTLMTTDDSFGGDLVVSDAGAFTGAVTIDTGVLEFTSAAAMGSGPIIFAPGFNGTLRIDGTVMPKATLKGFAIGNTIDLAGVAYSSSGTTTLESGNLLQVSENGKSYDLQLDPSASYSADAFNLSSDGDDGVDISLSKAISTPVWIPPLTIYTDRTIDILVNESTTIANSTNTATFENVGIYRSVSVTSELDVDNGGLTTTANFTNVYDTAIDIGGFDGGEGGSHVNVAGVLTNDFSLRIGNSGLVRSTYVTAGSLVNAEGGGTTATGELSLIGSKTMSAELDVNSAAGSGSPGVLSGDFDIEGEALLHFASGQISTISGELLINGVNAFIATGPDHAHNNALEGLSMIGLGADLDSENGASAVIDGDLTNEGFIFLDNAGDGGEHGVGGGLFSIGGKLTNEDQVYIGNANLMRSDEITANGVDNKSSIVIAGASSTATGTLSVTGTFENESSLIIDPFSYAHVSGDYQQTGSGTLSLYANSAGVFGALTVTGALSLAGGGAAGASGSQLQVTASLATGASVPILTFAPGQLTGMFGGVDGSSGTYVNLGNGTYGGVLYEDSLGKLVYTVVAAPTTTADTWTAGASGDWSKANWSNGAPTFYTDATLGANASVTLSADTTLDSLTLDASASLTQQSGHSLSIGQGLAVAAGATLTVDGEMTIGTSGADTLPGTVIVNGWLEVRGIASGGYPTPNGSFAIDSGGTLELDRLDQNNVAFSGAGGTLMLGDPGQFEGTISGFGSGDSLQVAGDVTSASYNSTSHELTLVDNGSTINLAFIPLSSLSTVLFGLTGGSSSTTITSSVVWDPTIPGEPFVWNAALNWTPDVVPGANNAVTIGANFTVASDADNSAGQLSLGQGATLTIGDDTTFTVDDQLSNSGVIEFAGLGTLTLSGSIVNSGEIETGSQSIKGVAPLDFITLDGDVNISGSGKIVLTDPADILAAGGGPPSTLTLTSVIDGVGDISGMNLDIGGGSGLIIADGSVSDASLTTNPDAYTLTIDAAGPITNGNVLAATNSGYLVIKNDVDNIDQYATLKADNGTIDIEGITVYAGTLQTSGYGLIVADNATLDGSTDGALINTGVIRLIYSGSSLTLTGSIENDGTIALTAANEKLVVDGNVLLGLTFGTVPTIETGVILEGESDQVAGNAQGALTLASGLMGVGTITMPGGITIDAGGFLLADADDDTSAQSGATLTIAKGGAITNGGVLGAFGRPPATLIIEDNVNNVGSGEISASSSAPSATVVISGVTITSGTIATNTDGSIEADNSTLNGVDIEGTVNLGAAGASLTLEGAIGLNTDDNLLNGTINFDAKDQTLVINGSVSVSGPGKIYLTDADDQVESEGTFTNAKNSPSSLTLNSEIAGEGTIGDAQLTLRVRSEGKIVAQGSNALILNTDANTITNAGTLESGGGELVIDSNVDNAGGTIAAYSGDVEISGVTISGGAFAGQLLGGTLLENGSVLDGSSQGVLTNNGELQIDKAQSTVTLEGAIDNAGIISFNSQAQSLLVAGNVTLTGGGLVSMNDSTDKFISNGHAATLSFTNQINGVGVIGDANATLKISSGGLIIADPSHDLTATSGDTLTITTGANTIVNQGALEAQNGGTLTISSNINNASGTIEANGAVSIVALNGITVAGGTLSTSANGVIEADDDLTLDGASQGAMTDNATVDLETKDATLTGAIANAGTLDLAAQKQKVTLSGNLTLTGAGSVIMGDIGDSLLDNGSPTTLTVGNTIAGVGVIGDTRMTLTISQGGSIVATPADDVTTVSGTLLTIGYLAAAIVNDGELSAADGATLFVKDGVTGSGDATISGGRLEFASAFSQQVQFTTGEAGVLQIDDVTAFGSEILGFTTDDTINLSKVAYDATGSVTLEAGNVLQVVENGTTYDFHLDPTQNYGGDKLVLSKDTTAGSDITVEAIPIVMQYIVPQKTDAINPEVGNLGDLVVGLDAQTTNAMVGSGGELKVESGGMAMGGSVVDGGVEYIEAGGSAEGANLGDPGLQVVEAGGSSTDTTISGGEQDVYGAAYSTDVQNGGLQVVEAKGVAYDAEVDTGGEQDVDGGADQGLYVDGGLVKVNDGGALTATTAINAGSVLLNDAVLSGNLYFGASGVVEVASGAEISGEIALAGDDATLRIDGSVLPTNEISGFGIGQGVLGLGEDAANNDVIDLANVAYDANWTAALGPNNALEIEEGGKTYDLNLDPTVSYVGFGFALNADSAGTGTAITVGVADAWTNSAGGDWATLANWSEGAPTSNSSLTSDAVIALPNVEVTIAASESETVGSLALDADDAVLNVAGKLTVDLALSVAGGAALDLASGGALTLSGTTTLASGTRSGSHPDALTINGALTIGASLANSSTVLEAGSGAVTLGASSGVGVANTSLGTWNISNDNGVALGAASAATFTNAGLLEKSAGSGVSVIAASLSDSGTLIAMTGTLELAGASNTIAGALRGPGTIEFAGGSTTLVTGASASTSHLMEVGAGASLELATNLTYVGAFTVGAGATLTVNTGDTLTLTGTSLLDGTVNGPGALQMKGGAATLDGSMSVGGWTSVGTTLALDGAPNAYAGPFIASQETIDVNGATILNGTNVLTDVTIDGVQHLRFLGLTTLASGLTLGGSAALVNYSTVTQNSGAIVLGDSSGNAVTIFNEAGSTWKITDDSGMALGNEAASSVTNAGLLEKTGGTGISTIAAAVANSGKVEAASGTLDVKGAITGIGSDIVTGASTLEFEAAVAAGQTVSFTGANGALDLTDYGAFDGALSGFDTVGTGDTIDVAGSWTWVGFTENSGQTSGLMTFADGAARQNVTLMGNYAASDFAHQVVNGVTQVTYL